MQVAHSRAVKSLPGPSTSHGPRRNGGWEGGGCRALERASYLQTLGLKASRHPNEEITFVIFFAKSHL